MREFPYDFLYGSIAADTSIAKKYAPVGRHCHSWNVGMEIYDGARDDPLRAFGLGYLAHLAADSGRAQLLRAEAARGHVEHVGVRPLVLGEPLRDASRHGVRAASARADSASITRASDGLLDRVLSPTIFSTPTNRRIFRGMVIVADNEVVAADLPAHDGEQPLGSA